MTGKTMASPIIRNDVRNRTTVERGAVPIASAVKGPE
jgi:hypothetical protein